MKVKAVVIFISFLAYGLPVICYSKDKVVIIPMHAQQSARPSATEYAAEAAGAEDIFRDMIEVSEGDCFLTKVSVTNQDGTSGSDTNTCTIFVHGTPERWVLKARSSTGGYTECMARCLTW